MSRPRIELGSQELASCAITARPPQHDTTGARHRAFDVFQGSCYRGGGGGGYFGFLRLSKAAELVIFFRVHLHVPSCAQIVILDFEKCVLRINTVCVFTIPHHIRKLCVQNRLMLYGLLIRSASDPYSGPTLGKGGGGYFASSTTVLKGGGLSEYFSHLGQAKRRRLRPILPP